MSECSVLKFENVSLVYNQPNGLKTIILNDVSFNVTRPSIIQLIGPSGSGKSKLLRLINRLEDATDGSICVQGTNIKSMPIQKLRRSVQMMQQEPVLVTDTVMDNLKLPWTIIGERVPDNFEAEAQQALMFAKLEAERMNQKVDQLSVGQKQRVAFARALLSKPQILLLDEPTSALDANLAFDLLDAIRAVQANQSITVLMVTHRLDEVSYVNDSVAVISAGNLIEFGSSSEIMNNPQNQTTIDFLRSFKRNDRNPGAEK